VERAHPHAEVAAHRHRLQVADGPDPRALGRDVDQPEVKPNGFAPGPNGAGPDLTKSPPAQKPSLAKNERPPIDDDAT